MNNRITSPSRLHLPPDDSLQAFGAGADNGSMELNQDGAPDLPAEADLWQKLLETERQSWLKLVLMVCWACLLCAPSAFAASFKYSATVNKIYVYGTGSATLSNIKTALPGAPLSVVNSTNKIWLLSANLVVQDGCTLVLNGGAAGDVNQLRLLSLNAGTSNSFVNIQADWGILAINNTKITSWDTNANGPDTNFQAFGRAYIYADSTLSTNGVTPQNSQMFITNSEICFLGDTNSNEQGLVWKVSGVNPNPTNNIHGVHVYGSVVNSLLHDNYIGGYVFGATNMLWLANQVYNNTQYGLDLQDYSDDCLIQSNNFYNNANHGLMASVGCNQLTILGNSAGTNGASGIVLSQDSDGSLVASNRCVGNTDSGISVDNCDSNTLRGNSLFGNGEAGLRLTLGSAGNVIQGNQCATNKYGLYCLPGTGTPDPGDDGHPKQNLFAGNLVQANASDPILFTNSDYNTLATNSFPDLTGKLRFENSISNWLDGNNINTNLSIHTQGGTSTSASTYVRNETYLEMELVTNATAFFEDTQGRIYQPSDNSITTAVSATGSILTLTATNTSTTKTVIVRDLYAGVTSGTAYLDHLTWNPPVGVQWTSTAGSIGQVLNFTVKDLTNNMSYAISRGSVTFTNVTTDATGQLHFSDTATTTSPVVYVVGSTTNNQNNGPYQYNAALNKIYVQNGITATLSSIQAALPTAPLTLVDPVNKIWLLSANLIVQDGSTLVLHGASAGGDVNQLRILSLNTGASNSIVYLAADPGHLDINGTKITSWDTNANGPDTNYLTYGRAYILARSSLAGDGVTPQNSRMDITNSELCFLGSSTNSDQYGVVWKVSGVDPNPTNNPHGVQVFGNVVNSLLHDNYNGAYTFGALNMQWLSNRIYDNALYGLDLQNYSDNALYKGNTFSNNQDQAFLMSDCYSNMLTTNIFSDLTGTLRFEGGGSNWLNGNIIPATMVVSAISDTNGPGSLYVLNQSYLNVEIDANSTVTFVDALGRIYQPTQSAILTGVSANGSVLTLTPAGIGSSTAVSARDFFATATPGTGYLSQLIWNPPANVQWTVLAGSAGQAFTFTVDDLAAGTSYSVSRGMVVVANITANVSGQVQFTDTPGTINPVVYSVTQGTSARSKVSEQFGTNGVTISWSGGSGTLQSTTNLVTPNWQTVVITNGPVLIKPALPKQFFRVVQ